MSVHRSSGEWRRRILGVALVVIAALAGWAAVADAADPPGNNGTVKVHDGSAEVSPVTHDDPHVCTFHLHFLFADGGQAGDWRIESWPPTGDRTIVLAGSYLTAADGEDRRPEIAAYSLPDGHYKLFWKGSTDHAWKQKVFWVECQLSSPSVSPSAGASPSPSPSHRHDPSPSPSAATPSASAAASGTGEVLDIVTTPPPTSTGESVGAASATSVGLVVLLLLVFSAAMQIIRLVAVLGIRAR